MDIDSLPYIAPITLSPIVSIGSFARFPVRYRYPRGYMLNRHSSLPFMPCPDYSKGYSADLVAALH